MKDTRLRDQLIDSYCDVMTLHNQVIKEFEAKIERYEKALREIAEEAGTPYAVIADKALKGSLFSPFILTT